MKQVTIYVSADMPGRTIIERTRATIAVGYAEARSGPEASPSIADRAHARAFRIVRALDRYHGTKVIDTEVILEGEDKAIDIYANVLAQLE